MLKYIDWHHGFFKKIGLEPGKIVKVKLTLKLRSFDQEEFEQLFTRLKTEMPDLMTVQFIYYSWDEFAFGYVMDGRRKIILQGVFERQLKTNIPTSDVIFFILYNYQTTYCLAPDVPD